MKPYMVGLLRKRDEIFKKIEDYRNNKCPHSNVKITHRGDTGNYDPYADRYWDEYDCPDCGKQWSVNTTNNSKPQYCYEERYCDRDQ